MSEINIYILAWEMKRGMTLEYLKCRIDLNFEIDFRINGAISTWVLIQLNGIVFYLDNGSFSSII